MCNAVIEEEEEEEEETKNLLEVTTEYHTAVYKYINIYEPVYSDNQSDTYTTMNINAL